MNSLYLGLGSNLGSDLGNRKETLERALREIARICRIQKISSVFETPALLPPGSSQAWNLPYLNLVVQIETEDTSEVFLTKTRLIESRLGRVRTEKWSPRTLDIDLLCGMDSKGEISIQSSDLSLPHPEIFNREFVLNPLAEIAPELMISGKSVIEHSKIHPKGQPRLMGILNITPDSFSDGGRHTALASLEKTLNAWDSLPISAIDIGGESTRPGAQLIDEETEWARVAQTFEFIRARYADALIKPKISIDTRHAKTAMLALEWGAAIINDVSGLSDPQMLEVLRETDAELILMHSLTIPPTKSKTLAEGDDPMAAVKQFFCFQLERLESFGISRKRIILDPGIGFGKTSLQSLVLIRRITELQEFGAQVLCGHSRKSFMKDWAANEESDRDIETLGISFELAKKGIDYLRVHDPVLHHRALLAGRQVITS